MVLPLSRCQAVNTPPTLPAISTIIVIGTNGEYRGPAGIGRLPVIYIQGAQIFGKGRSAPDVETLLI